MYNHASDADALPLSVAYSRISKAYLHVVVISIFMNVCGFSTIIFSLAGMTDILNTRNEATLISLFTLLIIVNIFMVLMSYINNDLRILMVRSFNRTILPVIHDVSAYHSIKSNTNISTALNADLKIVSDFSVGYGIGNVFLLPWCAVYVAYCFYVHFFSGIFSLSILLIIVRMGLSAAKDSEKEREVLSLQAKGNLSFIRNFAKEYGSDASESYLKDSSEVWQGLNEDYIRANSEFEHNTKNRSVSIKLLRYFASYLSAGILTFLALNGNASYNNLLPISILTGSMVGIGSLFVTTYPNWQRYKQAKSRLAGVLASLPGTPKSFRLPRPGGRLDVRDLAVAMPGANQFILSRVSFNVPAGSSMAVIGPSGAGKSSLVRALVGICPPALGSVRLDGSDLHQWDADQLGLYLGYLPQNVELLSGTIAENIARFGAIDDAAVLEAARLAGVHDVIQGLPQGYNTQVGEGSSTLSDRQRHLVGLARALYGRPALVVLDEANANVPWEKILVDTLKSMKERGTTCVFTTNIEEFVETADIVLALKDGTINAFGPPNTINYQRYLVNSSLKLSK